MRLITAHKILIGTSVAFFIFFSGWELENYLGAGGGWALARSVLYLCVAVGFAVYFKSLKNKVL
jgi:hypothetical protein